MVHVAWEILQNTLRLDTESLNARQMSARAVAVFVAALVLVRFGEKRSLGRCTVFDAILAIMLGSVLSRAINAGHSPSGPWLLLWSSWRRIGSWPSSPCAPIASESWSRVARR